MQIEAVLKKRIDVEDFLAGGFLSTIGKEVLDNFAAPSGVFIDAR